MIEVEVTRVVRFEAAHRLLVEEWSADENWRIYGKCSREGGHGHNYEVEVTVSGSVHPNTGFAVRRDRLDEVLSRELVQRCDHRDLNRVLPGVVTTGENLARMFFDWLEPALAAESIRLSRVRVFETPRNVFEISAK